MPGIAFVAGLSRLYTTRTPSLFDGQISLGIVGAVFAAIVIHFLSIGLTAAISQLLPVPTPAPYEALLLLFNGSGSDEFRQVIEGLKTDWPYVGIYFVLAAVLGFCLGKGANRQIRFNKHANWYGLLRGEDADFIWLTTDIDVGGEAFLYAGMVRDFRVSASGDLDRVVLLGAVRRPLRRPTPEEISRKTENYNDRGWIQIPGEYVILRMASARTVNIDYWYLEDEREDCEAIGKLTQVGDPDFTEEDGDKKNED